MWVVWCAEPSELGSWMPRRSSVVILESGATGAFSLWQRPATFSCRPAGGPEASFTGSGHAGWGAGGTWAADLRSASGKGGPEPGCGGRRPVAAAWPRSRVDDPAPSEMHLG